MEKKNASLGHDLVTKKVCGISEVEKSFTKSWAQLGMA